MKIIIAVALAIFAFASPYESGYSHLPISAPVISATNPSQPRTTRMTLPSGGVHGPWPNGTRPNHHDKYILYRGNGSTRAGWPDGSKWASFNDMWNNNQRVLKHSCKQFEQKDNSAGEIHALHNAILSVSSTTRVDPRFILAVALQESGGCVRAPTTDYGVRNPGIMQDHNGSASCNYVAKVKKKGKDRVYSKTIVKNPCPTRTITKMIEEGTNGTIWGEGLAQCIKRAGGYARHHVRGHDAATYYKAARLYNSGSIHKSGKLEKGIATHCYSSDVANRLVGWVKAPHGCMFDTKPESDA